ncbi:MAG: hypothetical protein AB7I30_19470 [Isosphaeraceae bacterium]
MPWHARWALPALLAGMIGCSNDNGLNLAKVSGKVTYNGQPVTAGEILFLPDESQGAIGPPASGSIGSDGTYVMSSEESGDGAVVGVHRVGVIGRDPTPLRQDTVITDDSSEADVLKAKASMGAAQKKDDGPTVRDRSGAVYRLVTPEKLKDPQTSGLTIKVEGGSNVKNITIKEDGTAIVE